MKKVASAAAVGALAVMSVYLATRPRSVSVESQPTDATDSTLTYKASLPDSAPLKSSAESSSVERQVKSIISQGGDHRRAEITAALDELKSQYGYAGSLNWDDAKAVVARRAEAAKALEDRLAKLGPGGAKRLVESYQTADDIRAKMLLIRALGKIQDDEASSLIQNLIKTEPSLDLERELIVALANRKDSASTAALTDLFSSLNDPQLRFATAQALSGREDALAFMTDLVRSESSSDVQGELIRAIGLVGNDAAKNALAEITSSSLPSSTRQAAIQELARRFGTGALNILERSLSDPNEAIRRNAVTALAQLHNDTALALLQRTADSDSSMQVREWTKAALAAAVR